jgi:hypothetical protein
VSPAGSPSNSKTLRSQLEQKVARIVQMFFSGSCRPGSQEILGSTFTVHCGLNPLSARGALSKASSSWVALLAHRQKFAAQTYSVVAERTSELFSVSRPSIQLAMVGATFTSHQISDSPTWSAWRRLYPVLKLTPNWHRRLGAKTQVQAGCNKLWSRL